MTTRTFNISALSPFLTYSPQRDLTNSAWSSGRFYLALLYCVCGLTRAYDQTKVDSLMGMRIRAILDEY